MKYILNSAVITSPGVYRYTLITPDLHLNADKITELRKLEESD